MVTFVTKSILMGYDELLAFGRSNVDALIQMNEVFAKAIQEVSKEIAALTQAQFERVVAASQEALAAKSPQEALKAHTAFATASIERLLTTSSKLGELNVKLATDTAAPLTTQLSTTFEKLAKRAA
jgi:phasin family protein